MEREPAQLLGLATASIAGAFTTTQSSVALIYDAMTVEWNNGAPDPARMPSTDFAIVASPAARGRGIWLHLRGHATPLDTGSIEVKIGGESVTVRPTEEDYYEPIKARLSADADTTPVIVTLDLPDPADGALATLTLDSIDVTLPAYPDGAGS
jgi:hypothetical protein